MLDRHQCWCGKSNVSRRRASISLPVRVGSPFCVHVGSPFRVRVGSPFRSISVGAVNVTFLGDERQSRFLFALDRRSVSMLDRHYVSMWIVVPKQHCCNSVVTILGVNLVTDSLLDNSSVPIRGALVNCLW